MAHVVHAVARGIASCVVCLLPTLVLASEPPDSAVNPRDGAIETTDSSWSGSRFSVRHTINPNQGHGPVVFDVAIDQADDPEPRLAISANGDTWVTWWRRAPANQVFIRKRTHSTGGWTEPRLVSMTGESGSRPRIVHDGASPWVAYTAPAAGGTLVEAVQIIDDGPDPFGPLAVASSSFTGDLDVEIDAEAGRLWVSWVDSSTHVGWCVYDYGSNTWNAPSYESYAGDTVAAARSRIRTAILGE